MGDNGSISKEVRLYGVSIGTPDPLDLSPDTLPKEVPTIPGGAGDYVIRRASGGARSWAAAPSAGLSQSQVDARVAALAQGFPSVVIASSNTTIPATARGNTYVHTGASNITYTLPPASGGGAVANGWEFVVSNQGSGDLAIDGNGSDTVNGSATLVISDNGRSVRLQKTANSAWVAIADTATGGTAFSPTKANIYDAVKGIFVHNTAVTADDANDELDFATGVASTLNDNSIAPIKAQADTDSQKKAWRARLASSRISQVSAALPAVTDFNSGDLLIVGRGGATTVTFVDVDAPATQLTTTVAGDIMMVLSNRWTRLGNLFSGGIAAQAAQATATAAKAVTDKLQVFGTIEINPPGIPDRTFPEFLALKLSNKLVSETIIDAKVTINGSQRGPLGHCNSPP